MLSSFSWFKRAKREQPADTETLLHEGSDEPKLAPVPKYCARDQAEDDNEDAGRRSALPAISAVLHFTD